MDNLPDSVKDDVKDSVKEVVEEVEQVIEQVAPILNIKVPEVIAEIPELIKEENVKKCVPSWNFVELVRSLISGVTKQKKIVTSE
jgi:hypothetical protein